MIVVFLLLLIDIVMQFFLPIEQKKANESLFCSKIDYSNLVYYNADVDQN